MLTKHQKWDRNFSENKGVPTQFLLSQLPIALDY